MSYKTDARIDHTFGGDLLCSPFSVQPRVGVVPLSGTLWRSGLAPFSEKMDELWDADSADILTESSRGIDK